MLGWVGDVIVRGVQIGEVVTDRPSGELFGCQTCCGRPPRDQGDFGGRKIEFEIHKGQLLEPKLLRAPGIELGNVELRGLEPLTPTLPV